MTASAAPQADLQSDTVLELIAGSTFVATAIRPHDELDGHWIDSLVDIIARGDRAVDGRWS